MASNRCRSLLPHRGICDRRTKRDDKMRCLINSNPFKMSIHCDSSPKTIRWISRFGCLRRWRPFWHTPLSAAYLYIKSASYLMKWGISLLPFAKSYNDGVEQRHETFRRLILWRWIWMSVDLMSWFRKANRTYCSCELSIVQHEVFRKSLKKKLCFVVVDGGLVCCPFRQP